MSNFTLQDPRTFDAFDAKSIEATCSSFFAGDKMKFLVNYFNLTNTQKFYALFTCVYYCGDIDMSKNLFLEELREDLKVLKLLNKPTKNLFEGYTNYFSIDSVDQGIKNCDALYQSFKQAA